jgi:hypothetical protein
MVVWRTGRMKGFGMSETEELEARDLDQEKSETCMRSDACFVCFPDRWC